MIALRKKDGGIRPIAMGNTLRRVASKLCIRFASSKAAELLSPRQVGFRVIGGGEAAAHAARLYLDSMLLCLK